MTNAMKLGALALSALFVAGCVGNSDRAPRNPAPRDAAPTTSAEVEEETTVAEETTFAVGEAAAAGDVVHTVTDVEVLDVIPEEYTLEEWDLIAESLPADEGFQWLRIMGTVTNDTGKSQTVDATNVVVLDSNGNEYDVSTRTTIYVDSDRDPISIPVQPTQTVEWEGYFMVVEGEGFMLKANDLSFLPEDEVMIDLGV